MSSTIGFISGIYDIQVALVTDDGYAVGLTAAGAIPTLSALVNDTEYYAYRVSHPVEITPLTPGRSVATDRGGQRIRGQRDLGLSDLGSFEITMSDYDALFEAIVTGSSINNTTVDGWTMSGPNHGQQSLPYVCLIATVGFQSRDSGTYGSNYYMNYIFPRVQISPSGDSGNQGDGENPNPRTYTVTPSMASKFITGQTWNDAAPTGLAMSYANGEAMVHRAATQYPLRLMTWIAHGTTDTFNLDYLPMSSLVALEGSPNLVCDDGTRVLPDSISTTTGAVDVSTVSPAAASKIVMVYPTNWVEV